MGATASRTVPNCNFPARIATKRRSTMMSTISTVSPRTTNVVPLEKRHAWTKGGPVVSHLEEDEITLMEERAIATIGDPQPLGLFAFATATWMLGTVIGGAFSNATYAATIPVLFLFGGVVLLCREQPLERHEDADRGRAVNNANCN
jgi:hypothetical protein